MVGEAPQPLPGLTVAVEAADGVATLVVIGELDLLTAPQLVAAIDSALTRRPASVVVDLAGVSFIDSTGIGVMMEGRRAAKAAGASFGATGVQGTVARVFKLVGVYQLLTGHQSTSDPSPT